MKKKLEQFLDRFGVVAAIGVLTGGTMGYMLHLDGLDIKLKILGALWMFAVGFVLVMLYGEEEEGDKFYLKSEETGRIEQGDGKMSVIDDFDNAIWELRSLRYKLAVQRIRKEKESRKKEIDHVEWGELDKEW